MAIKKTGKYKGKSNTLGGGGRFQRVVDKIKAKGVPEKRARAIAAVEGRKKLGKKKFQKLAAQGRKRQARKGK